MIVSDGRYKGTQHADGQKLITRLAASGCLVIWIAPSDTASTMTGARVVILADPAATSAGGRPRGRRQRPHRLTARPGRRPGPPPGTAGAPASRASRSGKGHARTRSRHRDKRSGKEKATERGKVAAPKS